jgi:rhodanese-related sulfurtransferase
MLPHILPMMDPDMAVHVEKHFMAKGVKILTGAKVISFSGKENVEKVVTDKTELRADMVIVSTGVRPKTELASACGLEIGPTKAIKVDEQMRSSDPDIYAVGDCAEKKHIITGKPCFIPLGSTANKEGRVAANAICGIADSFPGVLGSVVCRVFDFTVAKTGLSEKECRDNGFKTIVAISPAHDKAHFMPEAKMLILKLISDSETGRLLGAQAVGEGDGDKRVDVAATAMTAGMTADTLANLDLCYAPPYAPAMDNIIVTANIIRNKRNGLMEGVRVAELQDMIKAGKSFILLDVRGPSELQDLKIKGAVNIPLGQLRKRAAELDKNKPIIIFCKISLRGYEAALILKNAGFKNVKVLDGGVIMLPDEMKEVNIMSKKG